MRVKQRPVGPLRPGLRLFLFVALITLLLVGGGVALVLRNESEQRRRTIDSTLGFSEAAARSADQVLSDNLAALNVLATSPILGGVQPSAVQAVFDVIDVTSAGFAGGIAWVGADGKVKAATDRKPDAKPVDFSNEPSVKAILKEGQSWYVGTGFDRPGVTGPSVVLAVKAVGERGETVGVVLGRLSLERVARHLTGFRFGGSDLIVLDRLNQVVISGASEAKLTDVSDQAVVKRLRAGAPESLTGVTDPLGRSNRLVTAATTPKGDWLLMVSRSNAAAFGRDRRTRNIELGGLALAAFLALLSAARAGRRLERLQALADRSATAEQTSRERATRLRLAIAQLATTDTRRQLAEVVVDAGREALGAKAAALLLREDENPDMLHFMAEHGYPPTVGDEWDRHFLTTTTAGGAAVTLGRPIFLDTATMAEAFPETAAVLRQIECESWASLPLRADGKVFGALNLGFPDDAALAPERQIEASTYAWEVASALAGVRAREVEHEFALTLQQGLLPGELPANDDINVQARYLPSNELLEVGGDWYDVVERPDGATMLVVGDVVGHGVSAIAAMGQLSSVCRAVADEASPVQLLDYLDRLARRVDAAQGATAACVLIEPDRRMARYSIAGHPRPLLIEDGNVRELDNAVSIPLAYGETMRTEATVNLYRPSTLVLFTDGLIERRDSTYAERLDLLREIALDTPPADLCSAIVARMAPSEARSDDTVVMVVHLPAQLAPVVGPVGIEPTTEGL